jgi:ADP-L-glycero-D-manno-heptose 6-epimerase
MSRQTILVTGGAGFIGSNIVARLAEDPGLCVVVCDRLRDNAAGKWRNLAKHPIGDFISPDELWPWLAGQGRCVDAVIHMGAISSTLEDDADKIIHTNFGLSRDLFNWCAEHDRRFFYASSAATYGDGALGFDDNQDWRWLASLRPLNPYGWSKALFDLYAARRAAEGTAPIQWVGMKFFNVYGPNEEHKGAMRSVISKIWPDVVAGRPVSLFASHDPAYQDGGQKRDFVYVRDVTELVAWLMTRADVSGVFNVGSGQARSFGELAEAVFKAAGRTPMIDYVEMPAALRERYQYFTEAPLERLRIAGYSGLPTGLEEGVADYVQGYLARADIYR